MVVHPRHKIAVDFNLPSGERHAQVVVQEHVPGHTVLFFHRTWGFLPVIVHIPGVGRQFHKVPTAGKVGPIYLEAQAVQHT